MKKTSYPRYFPVRVLPMVVAPPPSITLPAPVPAIERISPIPTEKAPSIYIEDARDNISRSDSGYRDSETNMLIEQSKIRFYADLVGLFIQCLFALSFFAFVVMAMTRGGGGGVGGSIGGFIANKSYEKEKDDDSVVKFTDVAGLEGAKEELKEVVDFLKNPEKYAAIGAKIPKGCLLTGGPGLGKTLLAKAVAGEAEVPFFSCSASEFIELFVGVGASRIRDMFKKAQAKAPCIIFIDEIDAIGKTRSPGGGGFPGNDEREQTINQLLTEMDGFDGKKGIVVIAATNRPDILDSALVRPGRFDRQIALELPSVVAREAILKVHAVGKPMGDDVSLESVAKLTAGFSGAQLANLLNEAAILTARRGETQIGMSEIENAFDRIILGFEKKDTLVSKEKKHLVAYHEAGHALVALKIGDFDTIKKVSIIPRGKTGGVTMFEQDSEKIESGLYSKQYLENQLAVALGGRVAEELVVGADEMTTGASGDIERVQQVARAMITRFGFSDKLGPVGWSGEAGAGAGAGYSERTKYEIDTEVRKLAAAAHVRAKNILTNNKLLLKKIAEALMERETITGADIAVLETETRKSGAPLF
jgi:cell division protease FtsH